MKAFSFRFCLLLIGMTTALGCANIVPPAGGKRDIVPPKLVSVKPADSILNTRVGKVEMRFNEFITVSDVSNEVQVSPLLPVPVTMTGISKKATLHLPDSLLLPNTTYRITFGKSIKDLHEGNPIAPYTYVFSTGSYFDSLQLTGFVYDAATGLPDSGSTIILYDAKRGDSAVVREKPLYIGKSIGGVFSLQGLPGRDFRIYALRDKNNNLVFDGKDEQIGFIDSIVRPVALNHADTNIHPIVLNIFKEYSADTGIAPLTGGLAAGLRKTTEKKPEGFTYTVSADTSNIKNRSQDITKPLKVQSSHDIDSIKRSRIYLGYDSSDISVESAFYADIDSVKDNLLLINTTWKENTVYTLRLLKGFIKDTAANEAMPSKYIFRTRSEEDYSKLDIHLPSKYYNSKYLLLVKNQTDTVWMKPVTDSTVHLQKLNPGGYTLSIIIDENRNGKWDTGDLLLKRQPETVIPYGETVMLKPGWENAVDFEKATRKLPALPATQASPGMREKDSRR